MKTLLATLIIGGASGAFLPIVLAGATDESVYTEAVADPARPEADRQRDSARKPADVLGFFGIKPGMVVLDMFSGGGYYTEILARLVGEDGRVVAQLNSAYVDFAGDEIEMRYANARLPNVEVLHAENNELDLEAEHFDAITMILAYHDTYWGSPDGSWPEIDREAMNAELFQALKPGGVLGIVDHHAAEGAGVEAAGIVHRIAREIAIADLEKAGFVLEAENDLLNNPEDNRTANVFDESIRGKTDRYVLRFRRPE